MASPSGSAEPTANQGSSEPTNNSPAANSTGMSFSVDISRPGGHGPNEQRPAVIDRDEDHPSPEAPVPVTTATNKKKKKKKSKSKKNKATQPSGFEDNYADAPLTIEEHAEEANELYHPSRGFVERIESCIQRYRARRKFDNDRKDVFDKYLSLGGIDTGPKAFSGGMDQARMSSMDAEQIHAATAIDSIGADKGGGAWAVDFEGVVKCFFSSRVPITYDVSSPTVVHFHVNIVRNFLNYILYHNVCPEYKEQVCAARHVCDLAEKELPQTCAASGLLPGDFNIACSTLYGGYYQGMYSGDEEWAKELGVKVGLSDEQAAKVMQAAVSIHGTAEEGELVKEKKKNVHVGPSRDVSFEVIEIVFTDERERALYQIFNDESIKAVGKLRVKRWTNPYAVAEDVTDDEDDPISPPEENHRDRSKAMPTRDDGEDEMEFWIEDDILRSCFIGMKLEGAVRPFVIRSASSDKINHEDTTLSAVANNDDDDDDDNSNNNNQADATTSDANMFTATPRRYYFLDRAWAVYCSFYTNLPNELMVGWKKPVPLSRGSKKRPILPDDHQPREPQEQSSQRTESVDHDGGGGGGGGGVPYDYEEDLISGLAHASTRDHLDVENDK